MAEELDDVTWELLDGIRPAHIAQQEGAETNVAASTGLTMLLKMTRLHDLGLAQLCVPELVTDDNVRPSQRRQESESEGLHKHELIPP